MSYSEEATLVVTGRVLVDRSCEGGGSLAGEAVTRGQSD